MKRTYLTLIITMLVIGFAAVATNLAINGTINFGFNENDFNSNVVFTYKNTMHGEANINETGKSITFTTTKLENIDQESILLFDITNKSVQYDASVTIECSLEDNNKSYEDYIDISQSLGNSFNLPAGETKTGKLTVKLKKAYNESLTKDVNMLCTIVATPKERDTEGTYTPVDHQYEEIFLNGADPVLEAKSVQSIALTATNTKKLIPVIINDDGSVTRADTTKKWYDYENKNWANAVILVDGKEDPGANQKIDEEDIESYFVWIPKYRYKLWNVDGTNNVDPFAIEVEFGTTDTSDSIDGECKTPISDDGTQALSGDIGQCENGEWMTHPAFITMGVNGFWVGKFEVGYKGADATTFSSSNVQNTNSLDLTKVLIKPNQYSWIYIDVSNTYNNSFQYKRELESHLMKNTEWGAVAYLSHSMYGTCRNDNGKTICNEIMLNNTSNKITGYSSKGDLTTEKVELKEDGEKSVNYLNKDSIKASTTGNYTGIYDMSGGANERVMAVLYDEENREPLYSTSGFSSENFTINSKYYDKYEFTSSEKNYDKRILGDATGETNGWYSDMASFVIKSGPWFSRGGVSTDGNTTGLFRFLGRQGQADVARGFRIVLSPQ